MRKLKKTAREGKLARGNLTRENLIEEGEFKKITETACFMSLHNLPSVVLMSHNGSFAHDTYTARNNTCYAVEIVLL